MPVEYALFARIPSLPALADDPIDIIRAQRSVVWAEPPFERPRDSIGLRP
ncbi:hypothetical protein [Paraburkholderia caffeinilytica]